MNKIEKVYLITVSIAAVLCGTIGYAVHTQDESPVNNIIGATVVIKGTMSHGSGVYLGKGIILTAKHCLGMEGATILDSKGNIYKIEKEVAAGDTTEDVGFIKISKNADKYIPIVSRFGRTPHVSKKVFICGNPLDDKLFQTFTTGTVIKIGVDVPGMWDNTIISDASAYKGNSGGGVFDRKYRLVGVVVGIIGGNECLTIIEPIEDIVRVVGMEL